jgi:hypothetical protein
MISPTSRVKYIIIENTKERLSPGENVIDVAEYLGNDDNENLEAHYYQLKHTTVQKYNPFTLSELRSTFIGFSTKYKEHIKKKCKLGEIFFNLITNRPVSENLKANIRKLVAGQQCNKRFINVIEGYTKLTGKKLIDFLKYLSIIDDMGDYNEQRWMLHTELSRLIIGNINHPQIDSIITLVSDKALPDSDGLILPEDVLKRFGCTSKEDLYPAPVEYEKNTVFILTTQHQGLIRVVLESKNPVIIHAAGGIGKSVFAQTIPLYLTGTNIAVVYDCFGAGKYRNPSKPRHRHRDGLIQIINELAGEGLCDPLIAQSAALDDQILRMFLSRLTDAINCLRLADNEAQIIVAIDAADNAEMVAEEYKHSCFAHNLLHLNLPDGCQLIMLCRTERIHLLQPNSTATIIEMFAFSEDESTSLLRRSYPNATDTEGLEFHRLTNGNPRIQANALEAKSDCVSDVLTKLGPKGTTVEKQIEGQLDAAIERMKEKLPHLYQDEIDAICCGLSALPPFIPISILASVAEVEEAAVKSFVTDLGRPVLVDNSFVQFRDEPVETWFRQRFSGTPQQYEKYVSLLSPLSARSTYVAESLPSLYLQAELYSELVELALSDKLLPLENPIDRRNVQIYRLQFAFKAALRENQYCDAVILAMLAGEEMAGNERQLDILKKNLDLIAPLQDSLKVQELAFKRILRGEWEGSENVFSASLLSTVSGFHGEALSYMRAAQNWMSIYFAEKEKNKDDYMPNLLEHEEIAELSFAVLNVLGIEASVKFTLSWTPPTVIYTVAQMIAKKLIDLNRIDQITEMAKHGTSSVYYIIALTHEMLKVGKFLCTELLEYGLDILADGEVELPKIDEYHQNDILSAIVSFAEVCVASGLSGDRVIKLLSRFIPDRAPRAFDSRFNYEVRDIFLRATALRKTLCESFNISVEGLLPEKFVDMKKNYTYEQDIREYKEFLSGLLPWYLVRCKVLLGKYDNLKTEVQTAREESEVVLRARYQRYDSIKYEAAQVSVNILLLCNRSNEEDITDIFNSCIIGSTHIRLGSLIDILRGANRLEHLSHIRILLNEHVYKSVKSCNEDTATRADLYIDIARAALAVNKYDAAEYFNDAVEIVSRFGDEIMYRWEAVASLAQQCCIDGYRSEELAYRFIRCAELVGDNVAREKYFDRNNAIRLCTRLSPSSGLAALSRWRDRDVGWFDNQFPIVATEVVDIDFITPMEAWGLSPLFEEYSLSEFATTCITKEESVENRKVLLEDVINNLRMYNTSASVWQKLKQFADEQGIENEELDRVYAHYVVEKENYVEEHQAHKYVAHETSESELDEIFCGLELTLSSDIDTAIKRFNKYPDSYYNKDAFWNHFFSKISNDRAIDFFNAFIEVNHINMQIVEEAFPHIPNDWKKSLSVIRKWPEIIMQIAKCIAVEFIHSSYRHEQLFDCIGIIKQERVLFYKGIVEGLSGQVTLDTAEAYFGFVTAAANILTPNQAGDLLDYSLSRFESHMDVEFSDGSWSEWLHTPEDSGKALTGFIWSALGSPSAETRWKAAHCVRRLGEKKCQKEIDALFEWLQNNQVDAFGSNLFPFYNLHARLYLFIALARLSMDAPELLLKHTSIILSYALNNMPHILIQKYASITALNIENVFANTYDAREITMLESVSKSTLPRVKRKNRHEYVASFWHQEDIVNTDLKFYHGYDIDRYWFAPLGRVFGVSEKQVKELATMVIIEDWKINNDGSYADDPRQKYIWNSSRYDTDIYSSHGEYPKLDKYGFYLSYHAMFVVASHLLSNMPVVSTERWYEDDEDPWAEWLNRHLIGSDDGYWLYDRRDAVPINTPAWKRGKISDEWIEEITDADFLEALLLNDEQNGWLNVYGSWVNERDSYRESVSISSALVSSEASQSLLHALCSCDNPHDYKLPSYEEENMEIDFDLFCLKGWVVDDYSEHRLDKYDKFSGEVYYPAYQIGKSIAEKSKLHADNQFKKWFVSEQDRYCIASKSWSYDIGEYNESELLVGKILSSDSEFLKELCIIEKCDIIIEIQMQRRKKISRYKYSDSDSGYVPPKHKVYVFSMEGGLRDENGSIEFRKAAR